MDTKDFQNPMSFKEALGLLMEKYAAKGKDMPILVDTEAFEDGNRIYDTQVQFPPLRFKGAEILRFLVDRVEKLQATFIIRRETVIITSKQRSSLAHLLREKVLASFVNTPLVDALEELSYGSGVSIVVDPRVKEQGNQRLTALFKNNVSLEAAVRMLADMADLKPVLMEGGIYITTPANAKVMRRELKRNDVPVEKKSNRQPKKLRRAMEGAFSWPPSCLPTVISF